jgi:hypothetical protein
VLTVDSRKLSGQDVIDDSLNNFLNAAAEFGLISRAPAQSSDGTHGRPPRSA